MISYLTSIYNEHSAEISNKTKQKQNRLMFKKKIECQTIFEKTILHMTKILSAIFSCFFETFFF
jgi:hypothetical protein